MSKQEFLAINKLFKKKNDKYIINDLDKNLGAAAAEFYDIKTYLTLSMQEMEILIAKIQSELYKVVNKFPVKKECSRKEASFLMTKSK